MRDKEKQDTTYIQSPQLHKALKRENKMAMSEKDRLHNGDEKIGLVRPYE